MLIIIIIIIIIITIISSSSSSIDVVEIKWREQEENNVWERKGFIIITNLWQCCRSLYLHPVSSHALHSSDDGKTFVVYK